MGVEVAKGDAGVAVCMQGRKELIKERHIVGGYSGTSIRRAERKGERRAGV